MQIMFEKKEKLICLVGFFCGVILSSIIVNCICEAEDVQNSIFNRAILLQLPFITIQKKQLFFLIAKKRLKWLFLFILLIVSPLKISSLYLLAMFFGYCAGSLFTYSIIQLGLVGILFSVCAVFPQILCWVACIKGIVFLGKSDRSYNKMKCVILSLLMFVLAIFAETYVNPFMLSNFVKIFLF